jgi:hypothetical protein
MKLKLKKQKTMDDNEEPLLASRGERRIFSIQNPATRSISRRKGKFEEMLCVLF